MGIAWTLKVFEINKDLTIKEYIIAETMLDAIKSYNILHPSAEVQDVKLICEGTFHDFLGVPNEERFKENKDSLADNDVLQGEQKPTRSQVWDYCSKLSHEWYQVTMNEWNTLTEEEKNKYNQYIGFNDFSDMLMNIIAGALFQLRDTGELEYEEGSLLLEKPNDSTSAT